MTTKAADSQFVLPPIYSFSALKSKQREIKNRGKQEVVHITERGNAAYIFCSEEVLEREKALSVAKALEDVEIAALIRQGRKDVEDGNVIVGKQKIKKHLRGLWGRND